MTYMFANLFKTDPTKEFPYELSDKIDCNAEQNYFYRCRGKRKSSNEEFTVFGADLKNMDSDCLAAVKNCVRRLKTLKHPSFLTFIDSLETDALTYAVCEPVLALRDYLDKLKEIKEQLKLQIIARGIFQIANGINFLNKDAKLQHDNLCLNSIYVAKNQDWKIFGLEYVRPVEERRCSHRKLKSLEKYSCPDVRLTSKSPAWSTDCWGLACLIWEIFNGPMSSSSATNSLTTLKSPKCIPKILHSAYAKLLSSNPCSPADFISLCRQSDGFMNNKFVDFMISLEEFQLKSPAEKTRFFAHLDQNYLDDLPGEILKYKVLPQLINIFEFGDAGAKIMSPILRIGKLLDDTEYQRDLVPCIIKLFASPDRATRVKLLAEIESFIPHLQTNVINDKIFTHFVAGFMDTNAAVRGNTLKAVVHLAPKLSYNNLNVELMKHFACLQVKDAEPGIRTNATVCLGKIASYLHPQMRHKILIAAFTRAFHDTFAPARVAGVLALMATQQFYTAAEVGRRVLPAICALTVDADRQVRDAAFKAVDGFLQTLRHASDNPELLTCAAPADVGKSESSTHQWASWAFSALSSKFYKGQQVTAATAAAASSTATTPTAEDEIAATANGEQLMTAKSAPLKLPPATAFAQDSEDADRDADRMSSTPDDGSVVGGGDDWDVGEPWLALDDGDAPTASAPAAPSTIPSAVAKTNKHIIKSRTGGCNLDDDWASQLN